jgi:hypothetical protein
MNEVHFRMLMFAAVITAGTATVAAQTMAAPAQPKQFVLANDKLELTIATNGGRLSSVIMKEGQPISPLATMGHFLALDGFGAPSEQETASGMPFHGEATHQPFKIIAASSSGGSHVVTMQATLPLAQETLTRTLEAVDGENVIYVVSELNTAS